MHTTELPGATKLQHALIVFLLVFGLCLFGIVSRPTGLLSSFWPANAVLLALMVRYPALASPWGWLMAILGYMAADLITGSTVVKAALLNGANITGVAVGFFLFMRVAAGQNAGTHLVQHFSVRHLPDERDRHGVSRCRGFGAAFRPPIPARHGAVAVFGVYPLHYPDAVYPDFPHRLERLPA